MGLGFDKELSCDCSASRIYRIDESAYIITSDTGSWTSAFTITNSSFSLKKIKGLIDTDYSLLISRQNNEILQITRQALNHINKNTILFEDEARFALISNKSIVISFFNYLHLYQNLVIVHILPLNLEIINVSEHNGMFFICLKSSFDIKKLRVVDDSLIELEHLSLDHLNLVIAPLFYFKNDYFEAFSDGSGFFIENKHEIRKFEINVARISIVKDTGRMYELFLEGIEKSFVLKFVENE